MFGRGKLKTGEDSGYGMVAVNCSHPGLSERERQMEQKDIKTVWLAREGSLAGKIQGDGKLLRPLTKESPLAVRPTWKTQIHMKGMSRGW